MWQKKPGPDHNYIDGRTMQHNIHLFNSVTGGEHNLHILLKSDCCAVCKRPFNQGHAATTDPGAELEAALAMLQPNHAAILDYSRKHNVPILIGELASTVPETHRLVTSAGRKLLVKR